MIARQCFSQFNSKMNFFFVKITFFLLFEKLSTLSSSTAYNFYPITKNFFELWSGRCLLYDVFIHLTKFCHRILYFCHGFWEKAPQCSGRIWVKVVIKGVLILKSHNFLNRRADFGSFVLKNDNCEIWSESDKF